MFFSVVPFSVPRRNLHCFSSLKASRLTLPRCTVSKFTLFLSLGSLLLRGEAQNGWEKSEKSGCALPFFEAHLWAFPVLIRRIRVVWGGESVFALNK